MKQSVIVYPMLKEVQGISVLVFVGRINEVFSFNYEVTIFYLGAGGRRYQIDLIEHKLLLRPALRAYHIMLADVRAAAITH